MKPAGVDVIVPCYNYGCYLRQCVASVLRERRIPIRVLIIDDASDDGSAAEARRIAMEDDRVEFIVHHVNQGHIATFNEGIDWVRADYMLLLSADDLVAPGALARAVGLMESHPDVAFVHGRAVRFSREDELHQLCESVDADGAAIFRGVDFIGDLCARPVNPVETATAVVRSRIQKRVGGYRPQLLHAGDLEMWLRCAAHGNVGVIGAVQGYVRLHGANMRDKYKGAEDYQQRYEAFRDFFDHHSAVVPGARQLRRQAQRSLARELLQAASNALDHGRRHAWMIALAREFWPRIRWTGSYWRLALKRVVAPLLARGTRPGSPKSRGAEPAQAPRLSPGRAAIPADHDVLVSLIISTRDRAKFLEPFLASLDGVVTRHPWEIVIVDNGSKDETWSILTHFAKQSDKNIILLSEPKPGLSCARNTGVRAANGKIICFTDDDCYPRSDLIDSVVEVFKDDDIGFMGGQILLHDPEDDPVCITTRTRRALFPGGSFITTGDIQGACMAFRREVFADIGLFDTAFGAGGPLKGAEDSEMIARACFAGWSGGFFTEPVIYHHHRRRGEGSARITLSYDYSRGSFFAKLLLKHPGRWKLILQNWYWATPIFWRPSRRVLTKFWREVQGACHYAFSYSWSRPARLDPAIPAPTP